MSPDAIFGLFFVVFGASIIFCMYKDFDFLFQSNNVEGQFNALVNMFGRGAVRVFYGLLGAFLILLGTLVISGKVKLIKPKENEQALNQPIELSPKETRLSSSKTPLPQATTIAVSPVAKLGNCSRQGQLATLLLSV
ncbi:MAG: immunity 17 family protein [Mariniblastus sp.]|nr:immunity 17 family protein [Mariniblastus sp.]